TTAILSGNTYALRRRNDTGVSSVRYGCVSLEMRSTRLAFVPAMDRRPPVSRIIASVVRGLLRGARRGRGQRVTRSVSAGSNSRVVASADSTRHARRVASGQQVV